MNFERSRQLFERARQVIPEGIYGHATPAPSVLGRLAAPPRGPPRRPTTLPRSAHGSVRVSVVPGMECHYIALAHAPAEGAEDVATPRPWNENGHAIVQAEFAVDLGAPVTPPAIREILSLYPKVRERYPRRQELNAVQIAALGTGGVTPPTVPGEMQLGGFIFDSLKPNGETERSITLVANRFSVMRADYEGWDRSWGEAREIFVLMLPVLLERSSVIGFHLQYHDRFVWDGERCRFRAEMVFRKNSRWLAPNVFEAKDLWHSHHGFFEYPEEPHNHQLLNVLEAQFSPLASPWGGSDTEFVADVKLNHMAVHGIERTGGRPVEARTVNDIFGSGDGSGLLDIYMRGMHDRNKLILSQTINDEMCDRIGLSRPE